MDSEKGVYKFCGIFKNTFFTEYLRWLLLIVSENISAKIILFSLFLSQKGKKSAKAESKQSFSYHIFNHSLSFHKMFSTSLYQRFAEEVSVERVFSRGILLMKIYFKPPLQIVEQYMAPVHIDLDYDKTHICSSFCLYQFSKRFNRSFRLNFGPKC